MLPSKSANSIQVMKMMEALAKLGESELLLPNPCKKTDISSLYSSYGVSPTFGIKYVKTTNFIRKHSALFGFFFGRKACNENAEYYLTRDPMTAFYIVMRGKHVFLELHGDVRQLCGRLYRIMRFKPFVESKFLHLGYITQTLKQYYGDIYGLKREDAIIVPDGCTIDETDVEAPKFESRLKIGYFGKFSEGKGIKLVKEIACLDKDNDYHLYGGDKEAFESICGFCPDNVVFHGRIDNCYIPDEMAKMNILLLPNQEVQMNDGEDIGRFTSPLKLFEYMASGRIIVASDLSVIREILDEKIAYLCDYTNPTEWCRCIKEIRDNEWKAKEKGVEAKKRAHDYTWESRAEKIIQCIK